MTDPDTRRKRSYKRLRNHIARTMLTQRQFKEKTYKKKEKKDAAECCEEYEDDDIDY